MDKLVLLIDNFIFLCQRSYGNIMFSVMFVCHSAHKVVPVPGPAQLSPSPTLGPSHPPLCTGLWPQPLHPGHVQTCSLENVDGWQAGSGI